MITTSTNRKHLFFTKVHQLFTAFSNEVILAIDEYDGLGQNQLFKAVEVYLGSILSPSTKRLRATLPQKEKKINVFMESNEELTQQFNGIQLKWRMVQDMKLFMLGNDRMMGHRGNPWQSVNLDHPATFDTLAMDTDDKKMVINDLENFVRRKELYRKVGKAWKRGYLLFGPPGTGKSSLIAAIANYLKFDIYDLELTDIRTNSDLRRYLISTANQSILVVEDIDCSIELTNNRPKASRVPMHPHQYGHENRFCMTLSFA
ncbi:unnamed protein product [Coffea canephora]|uniref:DH200=94 genomic scaffold, scaffold_1386 n=1 Tax=Coffea canephora TaxID=49390 RepID=A0A068VLM6_COFCA|nr:unnamed protein product [Coffea canephora]